MCGFLFFGFFRLISIFFLPPSPPLCVCVCVWGGGIMMDNLHTSLDAAIPRFIVVATTTVRIFSTSILCEGEGEEKSHFCSRIGQKDTNNVLSRHGA